MSDTKPIPIAERLRSAARDVHPLHDYTRKALNEAAETIEALTAACGVASTGLKLIHAPGSTHAMKAIIDHLDTALARAAGEVQQP